MRAGARADGEPRRHHGVARITGKGIVEILQRETDVTLRNRLRLTRVTLAIQRHIQAVLEVGLDRLKGHVQAETYVHRINPIGSYDETLASTHGDPSERPRCLTIGHLATRLEIAELIR